MLWVKHKDPVPCLEPLRLCSLNSKAKTPWSHLFLRTVSFLGALSAVPFTVLTLAYGLAPNTHEYCPSFYNYFWGLEVLSPKALQPSHKPHETEVSELGPHFKLRHLQEAVSQWWQHPELLDISAS